MGIYTTIVLSFILHMNWIHILCNLTHDSSYYRILFSYEYDCVVHLFLYQRNGPANELDKSNQSINPPMMRPLTSVGYPSKIIAKMYGCNMHGDFSRQKHWPEFVLLSGSVYITTSYYYMTHVSTSLARAFLFFENTNSTFYYIVKYFHNLVK